MSNLLLQCRCGRVKGTANNIEPAKKQRVICCCDSCQDFASYLGRKDQICDKHGGTDILQFTPSQITITEGLDQVDCVRITDSGTYRWYTQCCHTAIANTAGPKIPFVGLVTDFIQSKSDLDETIGPVRAVIQIQHAYGTPDHSKVYQKWEPGAFFVLILKMVWAKLTGKGKPNPFFTAKGQPIAEPHIYRSG